MEEQDAKDRQREADERKRQASELLLSELNAFSWMKRSVRRNDRFREVFEWTEITLGRKPAELNWLLNLVDEQRTSFIHRLQDEIDFAHKDFNGMTILHHAVRVGCYPVAALMIDAMPDLCNMPTLYAQTPASWTPLMCMCDRPKPPNNTEESKQFNAMGTYLVKNMKLESLYHKAKQNHKNFAQFLASRGNRPALQHILQEMHKLHGLDAVTQLLNQRDKDGKGTKDVALASNIQLAEWLAEEWRAQEQLVPRNPRRSGKQSLSRKRSLSRKGFLNKRSKGDKIEEKIRGKGKKRRKGICFKTRSNTLYQM